MFRGLFKICVQFLLFWGRVFHFSYEKISVVINLYLQGAILVISGILPFIASGYALVVHPSAFHAALSVVMLVYASLYGATGYMMFNHYPPRWDYSFDLCTKDLLKLCDALHVSYVVLNLIIFVMWWLAVIFVNLLLSAYILR